MQLQNKYCPVENPVRLTEMVMVFGMCSSRIITTNGTTKAVGQLVAYGEALYAVRAGCSACRVEKGRLMLEQRRWLQRQLQVTVSCCYCDYKLYRHHNV